MNSNSVNSPTLNRDIKQRFLLDTVFMNTKDVNSSRRKGLCKRKMGLFWSLYKKRFSSSSASHRIIYIAENFLFSSAHTTENINKFLAFRVHLQESERQH